MNSSPKIPFPEIHSPKYSAVMKPAVEMVRVKEYDTPPCRVDADVNDKHELSYMTIVEQEPDVQGMGRAVKKERERDKRVKKRMGVVEKTWVSRRIINIKKGALIKKNTRRNPEGKK